MSRWLPSTPAPVGPTCPGSGSPSTRPSTKHASIPASATTFPTSTAGSRSWAMAYPFRAACPTGGGSRFLPSLSRSPPVIRTIEGGNGRACRSFVNDPYVNAPFFCRMGDAGMGRSWCGRSGRCAMNRLGGFRRLRALSLALVAVPVVAFGDSPTSGGFVEVYDQAIEYTNRIDFPPRIGSAGDPIRGQRAFGLSADGTTIDSSEALFTGVSAIAGPVQGNGRVCATCHRPIRACTWCSPDATVEQRAPRRSALHRTRGRHGARAARPSELRQSGAAVSSPESLQPPAVAGRSAPPGLLWRKRTASSTPCSRSASSTTGGCASWSRPRETPCSRTLRTAI